MLLLVLLWNKLGRRDTLVCYLVQDDGSSEQNWWCSLWIEPWVYVWVVSFLWNRLGRRGNLMHCLCRYFKHETALCGYNRISCKIAFTIYNKEWAQMCCLIPTFLLLRQKVTIQASKRLSESLQEGFAFSECTSFCHDASNSSNTCTIQMTVPSSKLES